MATVIEAAGVDLEDNDSAREYAIAFVSELFQSRSRDFPTGRHVPFRW